MSSSQRKAESSYQQRQREAGMIKVCIWVPKEKADRLKAFAQNLRDEE